MKERRKLYGISVAFALMIVVVLVLSFSLKTNAKENNKKDKVYTSILIEKGDSLWSIASENHPSSVAIKDYINDLKSINGISSDDIHEGNYITIYYFS